MIALGVMSFKVSPWGKVLRRYLDPWSLSDDSGILLERMSVRSFVQVWAAEHA